MLLLPFMDEAFINPVDKDKTTDKPGLIEYAHHVGSALIKPVDKGKLMGRSLAAMYEQTDLQLEQIRKQITLLAEQVREIERRKEISERIYASRLPFEPVIGNTYHLYEKEDGSYQLSMLSPLNWGSRSPKWQYVSAVRLLGDHTWQIVDNAH